MSLDYTAGCVNFRDVGEVVNLIADATLIPTRRLYRGGKVEFVRSLAQVGGARSMVNLRVSADPEFADVRQIHIPATDSQDKYETSRREVRRWLNAVMASLADPAVPLPVLVHCTSGKDRTGVVIAAFLTLVGVPRPIVVDEYLWSEGEVRPEWIAQAIDGLGDVSKYFDRVSIASLRRRFLEE